MVIIEDQGMVREVLAGKREAYRRLVEKYQGRVAAAISRVIGFRPEVEDLVQETFWQAYRSLGRFRGEARFSTWLMRIAVNKAIDFQRRRREERCYLAADHTPLAEISSRKRNRSRCSWLKNRKSGSTATWSACRLFTGRCCGAITWRASPIEKWPERPVFR